MQPAPAEWRVTDAPAIPLVSGLTVVTAIVEERGDYESLKRIEGVTPDRVRISYTARGEVISDAGLETMRSRREVLRSDLASAHGYRMIFTPADKPMYPGMTALGVSTAVYRELAGGGTSTIDLFAAMDETATLLTIMEALPSDLRGSLQAVSTQPEPVSVLVNGERRWLASLHARGMFEGMTRDVPVDLWILDSADNPLMLRARVGEKHVQAVRIDVPQSDRLRDLEAALTARRTVEIWGLY
ncbi:MAG: hypothetical protein ACREXP_31645, partial [Steroidobacteraceae bacterium]